MQLVQLIPVQFAAAPIQPQTIQPFFTTTTLQYAAPQIQTLI